MKLDIFNYSLPKTHIAQDPKVKRSDSKLLVIKRDSNELIDEKFINIDKYFSNKDILVINDTKVIPARIFGNRKNTNGKVIIATSRPFDRYTNMKEKTLNWLNKNDIKFDLLIKKKDLLSFHYDLHVDDDLSQILQLRKKKDSNYILLSHNHKKFMNLLPNNVFLFSSLKEINAK